MTNRSSLASSSRASSWVTALLAVLMMIGWSVRAAAAQAAPAPQAATADLDAWTAAKLMGIGVNIGNTLENTATWETGWGNPPITKEYVQSLKSLGFNVVRLPVAWDTYAHNGQIDRDKIKRVAEVADWITSAGMFCVVNIHWDGGWIDSDDKKRFAKTYHTFSPEAERKYPKLLAPDRDLFRGPGPAFDLRVAQRRIEFRRRGLRQAGLRDAEPREPALHRHGPRKRRQQRQAPADHRRLLDRTSTRPPTANSSCRRTRSRTSSCFPCIITRRGRSPE